MLDLVLPLQCGGCGAPSTPWCDACATALTVRADEPHLVTPRLDPGVPVFSLGRYAGARRSAVIALKEHGRADLIRPLAAALRVGVQPADLGNGRHPADGRARADPPMVGPAPRRRPGHPDGARSDGRPAGHGRRAQRCGPRAFIRDSVGLSTADRQRNIAGRVRPCDPVAGEVLVVDDIVTTGATAAESVRVLQTAGARCGRRPGVAHA